MLQKLPLIHSISFSFSLILSSRWCGILLLFKYIKDAFVATIAKRYYCWCFYGCFSFSLLQHFIFFAISYNYNYNHCNCKKNERMVGRMNKWRIVITDILSFSFLFLHTLVNENCWIFLILIFLSWYAWGIVLVKLRCFCYCYC